MKVYSPVVSQVVPVGFADLAQAADELPGQELTDDRVRLKVHGRVGDRSGWGYPLSPGRSGRPPRCSPPSRWRWSFRLGRPVGARSPSTQ